MTEKKDEYFSALIKALSEAKPAIVPLSDGTEWMRAFLQRRSPDANANLLVPMAKLAAIGGLPAPPSTPVRLGMSALRGLTHAPTLRVPTGLPPAPRPSAESGLRAELTSQVEATFKRKWNERDGYVVPTDASLPLGNDAIKLNATVLYADLDRSTELVDNYQAFFAAEIYKTFLLCAAKVIRAEGGEVTAYDGDRVMAVFLGTKKNSNATKAALKINFAVREIVNKARQAQYPSVYYELKHVVGIDSSDLFVARSGVRGANDLVWIGRAANHAAKLAALPPTYPSYITQEVYGALSPELRSTGGKAMWEPVRWDSFDNRVIYRSNWFWPIT